MEIKKGIKYKEAIQSKEDRYLNDIYFHRLVNLITYSIWQKHLSRHDIIAALQVADKIIYEMEFKRVIDNGKEKHNGGVK